VTGRAAAVLSAQQQALTADDALRHEVEQVVRRLATRATSSASVDEALREQLREKDAQLELLKAVVAQQQQQQPPQQISPPLPHLQPAMYQSQVSPAPRQVEHVPAPDDAYSAGSEYEPDFDDAGSSRAMAPVIAVDLRDGDGQSYAADFDDASVAAGAEPETTDNTHAHQEAGAYHAPAESAGHSRIQRLLETDEIVDEVSSSWAGGNSFAISIEDSFTHDPKYSSINMYDNKKHQAILEEDEASIAISIEDEPKAHAAAFPSKTAPVSVDEESVEIDIE
jgi:hypothetical protein